ncbi:MAG: hypothetical protein KN64_13155 [Sulfurovum sp. AS07-7]|jgi:hypothetical protein|nr:MAG: hypothetical protein KN64_13155 [Sulfurovum sp. AS07-7]
MIKKENTTKLMSLEETFVSYKEARGFALKLQLLDEVDWRRYTRGKLKGYISMPPNIPKNPHIIYKNKGWVSYNDFLRTKTSLRKLDGENSWLSYEEARGFVRQLKLKGQVEWKLYAQGKLEGYPPIPIGIPKNPFNVYRNKGWINIADFLGTNHVKGKVNEKYAESWLPFEEARLFTKNLKLQNISEWRLYTKGELDGYEPRPINIPRTPEFIYRNCGWIGFKDFLGIDKVHKRYFGRDIKNWLPFEEARKFVRQLKLKGHKEWRLYAKGKLDEYEPRPNNIPKTPNFVYKDCGWIGFHDFLGIEKKK